MIYVVVVKGAPPSNIARRVSEAHATALNSAQTRIKTNATPK